MSAARKRKVATKDLVVGLGATGLSIARYLRRAGLDAMFVDSRDEPPGLDALEEVWPDADIALGKLKLPKNVDRVIVSPGVADKEPLLKNARKAGNEIVSDIELFAREAEAPYAAITGSNGKSTVTTLLYHMGCAADQVTLAGAIWVNRPLISSTARRRSCMCWNFRASSCCEPNLWHQQLPYC